MPLIFTVALIVLVVVVLAGVAATLIDNAEEKVEHPESAPHDRHGRV